MKMSPELLINNDEDATVNPDLMHLSEEENRDAVLMLDFITTSIDAVDPYANGEDSDVALLNILDEALQLFDVTDPIHSHPEVFIEYFSCINIISNRNAGSLSEGKFQQSLDKWGLTGNSRDALTRFIHCCSNSTWGYEYTCFTQLGMKEHMRTCRVSKSNPAKTAEFVCRKPDCTRSFKTRNSRKGHKYEHDFEKRQCDMCTDGKWFTSKRQWNYHKSMYLSVHLQYVTRNTSAFH
jgi:hypothetical protein